jgi:hypothetical protein
VEAPSLAAIAEALSLAAIVEVTAATVEATTAAAIVEVTAPITAAEDSSPELPSELSPALRRQTPIIRMASSLIAAIPPIHPARAIVKRR